MRFRRNRKQATSDSRIALHEAEKQLEKIRARDPEVKEISGISRRLRVENHFGEKLLLLIRGS